MIYTHTHTHTHTPIHTHTPTHTTCQVVFVPAGWWHVVLNAADSTALSHSLTLRRDLPAALALLEAEDPEFSAFWRGLVGGGTAAASEM